MLKLTKKADYGIIALVYLAQNNGQPASCREISDKFCIPLPLLSNILKSLTHYGIVESVRGVNGGYRFIANPEELSLGALLEALEGPIRLTECMEITAGTFSDCRLEPTCPVRHPLKKLHERLRDWLKQIKFAEIAKDTSALTSGGRQFYEVAHLYGQPVHHQS